MLSAPPRAVWRELGGDHISSDHEVGAEIFGIRSGDWGGACGLRVAPHAPHPWGDAPARGVGCATFSRASATRAALAEKKNTDETVAIIYRKTRLSDSVMRMDFR